MCQLVSTIQKGLILRFFCSVNFAKLLYLLELKRVAAERYENVNDLNTYELRSV